MRFENNKCNNCHDRHSCEHEHNDGNCYRGRKLLDLYCCQGGACEGITLNWKKKSCKVIRIISKCKKRNIKKPENYFAFQYSKYLHLV